MMDFVFVFLKKVDEVNKIMYIFLIVFLKDNIVMFLYREYIVIENKIILVKK